MEGTHNKYQAILPSYIPTQCAREFSELTLRVRRTNATRCKIQKENIHEIYVHMLHC